MIRFGFAAGTLSLKLMINAFYSCAFWQILLESGVRQRANLICVINLPAVSLRSATAPSSPMPKTSP